MNKEQNKTASVLVIGNEILSGKTNDKNLNYIAKKLAEMGITFVEARVVRDVTEEIVAAVNELRKKYDYVFTTGGIGPTHDDITIDAIAKAFGVEVVIDEKAKAKLEEYYKQRGAEMNDARLRMAMFPKGAELVENPLTAAPGCKIENVFVLAGIPNIMQVMFDYASQMVVKGRKIHAEAVYCNLVEGDLAAKLSKIQKDNESTEIGSYPYIFEGKYAVSLVVRSLDEKAVKKATTEIKTMIKELGGKLLKAE